MVEPQVWMYPLTTSPNMWYCFKNILPTFLRGKTKYLTTCKHYTWKIQLSLMTTSHYWSTSCYTKLNHVVGSVGVTKNSNSWPWSNIRSLVEQTDMHTHTHIDQSWAVQIWVYIYWCEGNYRSACCGFSCMPNNFLISTSVLSSSISLVPSHTKSIKDSTD